MGYEMQQEQNIRQFDEASAKFIMRLVNELSGGHEFLEFRDNTVPPGVCVSETYIDLFPSGMKGIEAGNIFEWNPACDTEDGADPRTTPLLPATFTANELAAFLLYGVGDYIQESLGRIGQLDEDELEGLGGMRDKLPRQALRAAYAEAERAQQLVGPPDIEAQKLADSLSDQLDEAESEANRRMGVFARDISADEANRRRAAAIESVADLRKRAEAAKAGAAAKTAQWRKAMVHQLLATRATTPEQPAGIYTEQPARADAEREELGRLRAEAEARRQEEGRKAAEARAAEEARLAAELRAQQEAVRKQQEALEAEVQQSGRAAVPGEQESIAVTWEERIREVADELHRRDLKASSWSNIDEMANMLAVEAQKRGIVGPRGQLTAANIRRTALQGNRWKRPKN